MTCLKCGGLTVREPVSDFFVPFALYRCLLCGARLDAATYRNRIASKEAGVDMPKFMSEEHRQRWVESVRRAKQAKKQQHAGTANLPVPMRPAALASLSRSGPAPHGQRPASLGVDLLAVIDQTLAMLEQDRAVLERAKEILSRGAYVGAEQK